VAVAAPETTAAAAIKRTKCFILLEGNQWLRIGFELPTNMGAGPAFNWRCRSTEGFIPIPGNRGLAAFRHAPSRRFRDVLKAGNSVEDFSSFAFSARISLEAAGEFHGNFLKRGVLEIEQLAFIGPLIAPIAHIGILPELYRDPVPGRAFFAADLGRKTVAVDF